MVGQWPKLAARGRESLRGTPPAVPAQLAAQRVGISLYRDLSCFLAALARALAASAAAAAAAALALFLAAAFFLAAAAAFLALMASASMAGPPGRPSSSSAAASGSCRGWVR